MWTTCACWPAHLLSTSSWTFQTHWATPLPLAGLLTTESSNKCLAFKHVVGATEGLGTLWKAEPCQGDEVDDGDVVLVVEAPCQNLIFTSLDTVDIG